MSSSRPSGMFGFSVVWFGQLVSVLGSGMSQFALTIWAWQVTGQATVLALVVFFIFFPRIVMTPIAGALVDRWNRKLLMMLSDLAAGLGTVASAAQPTARVRARTRRANAGTSRRRARSPAIDRLKRGAL